MDTKEVKNEIFKESPNIERIIKIMNGKVSLEQQVDFLTKINPEKIDNKIKSIKSKIGCIKINLKEVKD